MRADLDPAQLTPEERFHEVAAIFATSLRRLRDRSALAGETAEPPTSENLTLTSANSLEVAEETSVTVHGG